MIQKPEDIKRYRKEKWNSPYRDRPIAESLKKFDEMKRGLFEEGEATLRMKQDMECDNFNMHDLIAYRIKASCNQFLIFLMLLSEGFAHNLLVLSLSSLLLIRAQEISGLSTQLMTMLTALLILWKILHIRYCYIIWNLLPHFSFYL